MSEKKEYIANVLHLCWHMEPKIDPNKTNGKEKMSGAEKHEKSYAECLSKIWYFKC